jgi:signal transduction histidine kinase
MGLLRATLAAAERGAVISSLRAKVLDEGKRGRDGVSDAELTPADAEREVLAFMDAVHRRIGHDLHDGLGQILVGASFMLRNLEDDVAPSLRADVQKLSATINEAITRVQSIARGLAPIRLNEVTITEALRSVCASVRGIPGVECTLDVDESAGAQSESTKLQICLIAQEAVRNALRHGNATRVEIALQSFGEHTLLTIRDNGCGIGEAVSSPGLGLQSMHYRAHVLGGSLEVVSLEGGGTLVRCLWSAQRGPAESATHRIMP